MQFDTIAPAFLVLAIALSWPRMMTIFRPTVGSTVPIPPLTMIASAVNLSCLGLAFSGNSPWMGCLIVILALALASSIRGPKAVVSVALSVACLGIYVQGL